jgi:hypothetical protein
MDSFRNLEQCLRYVLLTATVNFPILPPFFCLHFITFASILLDCRLVHMDFACFWLVDYMIKTLLKRDTFRASEY